MKALKYRGKQHLFGVEQTAKYFLSLCVLLSVVGLVISCSGSKTTKAQAVNFDQLLANPDKYNGKYVTIEGIYFHGFEVIVLSEELKYSGYVQGHLVPKGKIIWIEGGIPESIYDKLYKQEMMGPEERFGKVRLEGKFEYGGKYGHGGGYSSQIVTSRVELLEWSPQAITPI